MGCLHCDMYALTEAPLLSHADVREDRHREALAPLEVEHRLEHIALKDGVFWVNDSRATNVNMTWYSLEEMRRPLVWIAGGIDKGNDYSSLFDLVREKVRYLLTIGEATDKLVRAFSGLVPKLVVCNTLGTAVTVAKSCAERGDAVLLSPACASFDHYADYEDRGAHFKKLVSRL